MGLVVAVLFLAAIVLAAVAAFRLYRHARTDELIDEEAEAAKYIGPDSRRKRVSEQRLDAAGR